MASDKMLPLCRMPSDSLVILAFISAIRPFTIVEPSIDNPGII